MIIAVDIGNTRVKWGIFHEQKWLSTGFFPTAEVKRQLIAHAESWPADAHIVICNVAGHALEEALSPTLSTRFAQCHWLHATQSIAGITNSYESPQKLGADRWAALIGARNCEKSAVLVVCAGTATTIDWLDAEGIFRGGLIIPGFDLMRKSLSSNTAQLPLANGIFTHEPRNTHDAIFAGCLHAQAGAIERMYARLCQEGPALCLLTGGTAPLLSPCLNNVPHRIEEHLILTGLVQFGLTNPPTENL